MQRRKTLINALQNVEGCDKERVREVLQELGINDKVRGEALTLEDFVKIANLI